MALAVGTAFSLLLFFDWMRVAALNLAIIKQLGHRDPSDFTLHQTAACGNPGTHFKGDAGHVCCCCAELTARQPH